MAGVSVAGAGFAIARLVVPFVGGVDAGVRLVAADFSGATIFALGRLLTLAWDLVPLPDAQNRFAQLAI